MKQAEDTKTGELPLAPRPGRRPVAGVKQTNAARQAAYRERLAASGLANRTFELPLDVIAALDRFAEKGESRSDVVARVLRSQLMRKR